MNIYKFSGARTLTKETIVGKFGPFTTYLISGDTYPIKEGIKALGFSWIGSKTAWGMPEKQFLASKDQLVTKLNNLGINTSAVTQVENNPANPANQEPAIQEPIKPEMKQWITEDADLTKWYKFPINHKILEYTEDITIDGETQTQKISIDRLCKFSEEGSTYSAPKKSRDNIGHAFYVINVGETKDTENPEKINPISTIKILCSKIYGTYNEQEYLEELRKNLKIKLENNPTQKNIFSGHNALKWNYDIAKRTPELNQAFEQIIKNEYPDKFFVTLSNNGEYDGEYAVKLKMYSHDKLNTEVYFNPDIQSKIAPNAEYKYIGSIKTFKIHTVEELNNKIKEALNKDEVKKVYLEYLQSFPFLQSQQETSQENFTEISGFIANPDSAVKSVLNKIKDIGYIRPHKRQKQSEGLSSGEEIKWVVDSDKIKNDIYGRGGYVRSTPEYFYVVVAYYIHRQVRGIESWSDAMLVDSAMIWINNMKKFGADINSKTLFAAMGRIGDLIIKEIYGDTSKTNENQNNQNNQNNQGYNQHNQYRQNIPNNSSIDKFKNLAIEYGIDATDIENNLKGVYRQLVQKMHPDKFLDQVKKDEMTEKFKDLQNIWDDIVKIYRVSTNWYENYIFKNG